MSILTIYTDLDSIFDTRRGIIIHTARENGNPDFKWESFEGVYKQRRYDIFERPELSLTDEKYKERFKNRSIDDWADENECYFFPSSILNMMGSIVRSIEYGEQQTIFASTFDLTVNLYPFILSDELKEQLLDRIQGSFKFRVDVSFVYLENEQQTATYLNGFNYVFRYGHFLNPDLKKWAETYPESPFTGTKYIVPNVLAKTFDENDELLEVIRNEDPSELISKCSFIQGGRVQFVPIDKDIFDYIN